MFSDLEDGEVELAHSTAKKKRAPLSKQHEHQQRETCDSSVNFGLTIRVRFDSEILNLTNILQSIYYYTNIPSSITMFIKNRLQPHNA